MIPLSIQPLQSSSGSSGIAASGISIQTSIYTVQKGDTLYALARRYGTTANNLASINGIALNSILRIGQKLKVPARL